MPQPWKFWSDEELDEATRRSDRMPTLDEVRRLKMAGKDDGEDIWEVMAEKREEAEGCFSVVLMVLVVGVLLAGMVVMAGCGKPAPTQEETGRMVDSMLGAWGCGQAAMVLAALGLWLGRR